MKIDMHVHSSRSFDGTMSFEEIRKTGLERGLNAALVCDHDIAGDDIPVYDDFFLIPGTEVSCKDGHLIGAFIKEKINSDDVLSAAKEIHELGGIAILAHPFEFSTSNERMEHLMSIAYCLDGTEIFNSRAERKLKNANALAMEFADKAGLRKFGGSDAHLKEELGNTYVEIECDSYEDLKEALLNKKHKVYGKLSPSKYTAKSNAVARTRKNPSSSSFKFFLFRIKCFADDILYKKEKINVFDC